MSQQLIKETINNNSKSDSSHHQGRLAWEREREREGLDVTCHIHPHTNTLTKIHITLKQTRVPTQLHTHTHSHAHTLQTFNTALIRMHSTIIHNLLVGPYV